MGQALVCRKERNGARTQHRTIPIQSPLSKPSVSTDATLPHAARSLLAAFVY